MVNAKKDLRLFLTFLNGLETVKVVAPRHPAGPELCVMGVVKGKRELLDLFETAAVDNVIVCSGEVFRMPTFAAYERTPKSIIQDLERHFELAHEIPMKILMGEELTPNEEAFIPLISLHVAASSVDGIEGLKCVHDWFESKKLSASAVSA